MLTGDFKDVRLRAIAAEQPVAYAVTEGDLLRVPECIICGDGAYPLAQVCVGELEAFTTAVCRSCSYVWRAVTPAAAWFKRSAVALGERQVTTAELTAAMGLEDRRYLAYQRRLEFLRPYSAGGVALDVGAAMGSGVDAMQEAGFVVFAVEPDAQRAAVLREYGIEVIEHTVEGALHDGPRGEYGLIMLCHVLEHCRDPLYVLARLGEWLMPSGVIYVEVPSWEIINWSDAFYLAHMSNFSSTALRLLAGRAGLSVLAAVRFVHEEGRTDLGVVLSTEAGGVGSTDVQLPFVGLLRGLYRKGLSKYVAFGGHNEAVLRYHVPCFDHYNYGLRFDRYVARRDEDGIIQLREGV